MKKTHLSLLWSLLLFAACSKDDAPDPIVTDRFDPVFAQVLQARGYIADAKRIDLNEVKDIETLKLSSCGLTSLRGIEYFTSLLYLDCGSNQLTALDISNNTALTHLNCGSNQLTALDISSSNTALNYLDCSFNDLTALDISSSNTALTYLNCYYNQLTALDISKNTALTDLDCAMNPGDGTLFPITAWFDNDHIPSFKGFAGSDFQMNWSYDGSPITIDFRKAE